MTQGQRRVVITGVTRGLGRALALDLAARGHTVAGCGRSRDALDSLARELVPPHSLELVDVTDDSQVAAWAEGVCARGAPDLLINNAGIINRTASLWQLSVAEIEDVIAVNVVGTAIVLRRFLPAMIARGSGVVVNMSSGWGRATAAGEAPYCASKWAIEGLTGALAAELPPGLAAIAVNPGVIDTDMLRICFGHRANGFPQAGAWAARAVPYLLGLGAADNGASVTIPG